MPHAATRKTAVAMRAMLLLGVPAVLMPQLLLSAHAAAPQMYVGPARKDVVTAAPAHSGTMLPNAPGRDGEAPALAWHCIDEPAGETTQSVCFFSLASLVDYPTPPSATPPDFVQDAAHPAFDSRAAAQERCRGYWPGAELASPTTPQRNAVRQELA